MTACVVIFRDRSWASAATIRTADRSSLTFSGFPKAASSPLLHAPAELVGLRQAGRQPAGIGAIAAPVRQLLHGHAVMAPGGILPGQACLGVKGGDVG